MSRSEEEELKYTTDMIKSNFSNYSAWHNRRNGSQKSTLKVDRSLSLNSTSKSSSFKSSKPSPTSSGIRRSSPGSLGGATVAANHDAGVLGRVRVAVRLRPHNAEELEADADYADCVELQPEVPLHVWKRISSQDSRYKKPSPHPLQKGRLLTGTNSHASKLC